ncbi:hypothetical protein DM01DRAFT_1303887 [Hesseltinella vesiculosa]|uniref:C2H2-type domain-containing protein n=1 Tax=Hesseltinella vesiculosa TaxID=101127 RepID=A0A1X2GL94_9FUNG|nr:hypothetical protein DM01DRAFT_1303887 [Hesseltinella vesiculosa]
MAFRCEKCDMSFVDERRCIIHEKTSHTDVLYYGEDLSPLFRADGRFTCPKCNKAIENTRDFIDHVKDHGIECSMIGKRRVDSPGKAKRSRRSKRSMSHSPSALPQPADNRQPGMLHTMGYLPPFQQPPLVPQTMATSSVLPPCLVLPTTREVVLAAADCTDSDKSRREDILMLTKLGRWIPLIHFIGGRWVGLLTSASSAAALTDVNHGSGQFYLPVADEPVTLENCFTYVQSSSKISLALASTTHVQITRLQVDYLNLGWLGQLHLWYMCSQLLAGAVLVEGSTAIMVLTLESYSRDSVLDVQCVNGWLDNFTLPEIPGPHGLIKVCLLDAPDGRKLCIGTRASIFLVTGSIRLDTGSVNLGLSTHHFAPTRNTQIFLDRDSVARAQEILKEPSTTKCQALPSLYQLRHVVDRFDDLSTYTLCRASAPLATPLNNQPWSIWTLSDTDAFATQDQRCSHLFHEIAFRVFESGSSAVLTLDSVKVILTTLERGSEMQRILHDITALFSDSDSIPIIGNTMLNSYLAELASLINIKDENEKKSLALQAEYYYNP